MSKIVTANDLATGQVLFLADRRWVTSVQDATIHGSAEAAEAALDFARLDAARCIIVDPFVTDIETGPTVGRPKMTLRDTIRAYGPTIRYR